MTTYRQCIITWRKSEKEILRFVCFVGGRKSFGREIHKERSMNVNVNAWGRAVVEKAMQRTVNVAELFDEGYKIYRKK